MCHGRTAQTNHANIADKSSMTPPVNERLRSVLAADMQSIRSTSLRPTSNKIVVNLLRRLPGVRSFFYLSTWQEFIPPVMHRSSAACVMQVSATILVCCLGLASCVPLPPDPVQGVKVSTIASGMTASGGVSRDRDGRVYVSDFGVSLGKAGGENIYRMNPDGSDLIVWSTGFGGASGSGFGGDDLLYQSDVGRGEVWRVGPDGTRARIASGLRSPVGVAAGPEGRVFVAECGTSAITVIAPDGVMSRLSNGGLLNCPNGLTIGHDGMLYAVNFRDGALLRINPDSGDQSLVATLPGGGNGHIAAANNRLYVASFQGGRIYVVTIEGMACHIAGDGSTANNDGDGYSASFFRPNGVAISLDGNTLFTNTVSGIHGAEDKILHPNAVRRIDGLLGMLECPKDRLVTSDGAMPPQKE